MALLVKALLDWLRSLFWKEEMELTLVGLQNSGKTTLVNVLAVRAFFFFSLGSLMLSCFVFVNA